MCVFLAVSDELFAETMQNLIFTMEALFLDNQAYWIQDCRSTELTRD